MKNSNFANSIVKNLNGLLAKYGVNVGEVFCDDVKIGAKWCKYSGALHVWLKKNDDALVKKVVSIFEDAGFDEVKHYQCEHLGEPEIVQIDAR